ncbi:DUF4232 domain-containing protein [Streptomyces sp. NPDC048275]|uniref:DUF4232 domain-containing protein n=1 Tax=Streptomyces sp. NPDC048275 TaxID=3155629 RepID=UPI0033C20A8E
MQDEQCEYRTGIRRAHRRAAIAMVTASAAALLMTGCQPAENGAQTADSAPAVPAEATKSSAKKCGPADLEASMYQARVRPAGTGTGAVVVEFTNVSGTPCVVQGHPTVAGAGNGSPERNRPLKVTRKGSASALRVAPGGKAWTKLTFVQVQGEADGYCESGSEPVTYPTLVVGVPGAGAHQVALKDGTLAECDDKVTVTALSAAKPA